MIYAPAALLSLGGSAQAGSSTNGLTLIVDRLTLSGNAVGALTADGGDPTAMISTAGQLLAGDLTVYVVDPTGVVTADERARISDAIAAIDSIINPFAVTIT